MNRPRPEQEDTGQQVPDEFLASYSFQGSEPPQLGPLGDRLAYRPGGQGEGQEQDATAQQPAPGKSQTRPQEQVQGLAAPPKEGGSVRPKKVERRPPAQAPTRPAVPGGAPHLNQSLLSLGVRLQTMQRDLVYRAEALEEQVTMAETAGWALTGWARSKH